MANQSSGKIQEAAFFFTGTAGFSTASSCFFFCVLVATIKHGGGSKRGNGQFCLYFRAIFCARLHVCLFARLRFGHEIYLNHNRQYNFSFMIDQSLSCTNLARYSVHVFQLIYHGLKFILFFISLHRALHPLHQALLLLPLHHRRLWKI